VSSQKRNVALIGMMGSGKSTVGGLLAERLGWTFYDTDLLLEAAFGEPVGRIFQGLGEPAFRSAEALLVRLLMSLERAVLATGGGLWTSPVVRRHLASFAFTVYLDVPADVLWRRVESQGLRLRPALAKGGERAALEQLLAERRPLYELADCRVECAGRDSQAIVQQILKMVRAAGLIARSGEAA
jgi:shikimate kinase